MTIASALALFFSMALLAALPSASVLAVSAKAASGGLRHGALATAGIVVGDVIFVLIAIFGLTLLVETMGSSFTLVKYAGGAYLLWLGVRLWRSSDQSAKQAVDNTSSSLSSFMTGLLVTLGDQKAVLFYFGFLPAFLDLSALSAADVVSILGVTILAVGGVKLAYAVAADKISHIISGKFTSLMNLLAATVMFMAGVWVIIRA